MGAINTIGKSINSGLAVLIKDAANGLNCNCACYICNERLQAVQPKIGKIASYFRHHNGASDCIYNNETALHQYAKQLIFENNSINTSKGRLTYSEPVKESALDKYRSDIKVKYKETELHFEIVVHHDLHVPKEHYYKSARVNCIKIDLTDPELLKATPTQIAFVVLEDASSKDFVQWNEDKVKTDVSTSSDDYSWLVAIAIFLGSLLLLLKPFLGKSNRRRRYGR